MTRAGLPDRPLILASGSPRRQMLLGRFGVPFTVDVSNVDEQVAPGTSPEVMVRELAERKAREIARRHTSGLVIGSDTTVALGSRILEKPADAAEATEMLTALRAREHVVWTGVAVVDASTGVMRSAAFASLVRMRAYRDEEIAAYVATGEPLDKAGAYAIQGGAGVFVEQIDGCYANVVGLPLCQTARILREFGWTPETDGPWCVRPDGGACPTD